MSGLRAKTDFVQQLVQQLAQSRAPQLCPQLSEFQGAACSSVTLLESAPQCRVTSRLHLWHRNVQTALPHPHGDWRVPEQCLHVVGTSNSVGFGRHVF